jgi:hypothetical protein
LLNHAATLRSVDQNKPTHSHTLHFHGWHGTSLKAICQIILHKL